MKYAYIRDPETKRARLVEVPEDEPIPVELTTPPSASLDSKVGMLTCEVQGCGKTFRTPGVAAMHFKKAHPELANDKNTWKEFVRRAN